MFENTFTGRDSRLQKKNDFFLWKDISKEKASWQIKQHFGKDLIMLHTLQKDSPTKPFT